MSINKDGSIENNGIVFRVEPDEDVTATLLRDVRCYANTVGLKYTIAQVEFGGSAKNPSVSVNIDGMGVETFSRLETAGEIDEVARVTVARVQQRRLEQPAPTLAGRMPPMNLVKSQSIAEIGHDGDSLYVRFKGGSLYRYAGVTAKAYNELRYAESVGKHLQIHIMRHYTGVVVPEKE